MTWVVAPFNTVIAPGREELRLRHQPGLDQRRAQEGRRLLLRLLRRAPGRHHLKGSPIDGKTIVADLKDAKLGAQVGHDLLHRGHRADPADARTPAVFDNNDHAVQALKNKPDRRHRRRPADRLLHDRRRARRRRHRRPAAARRAARPSSSALVLDKGSPLTACVSQAVDALRADGTLDTLDGAVAGRRQGAPAEVAVDVGGHLAADGTRGGDQADPWVPSDARAGAPAPTAAPGPAAPRSSPPSRPPALVGVAVWRSSSPRPAGRASRRPSSTGTRRVDVLPGGARGPVAQHPGDARLRGAHRRLRPGPRRDAHPPRPGGLPAARWSRRPTSTSSAGCR